MKRVAHGEPKTHPLDFRAVLTWRKAEPLVYGSPYATLFITVLFLPPLTENLQYQRVIKDQAVPGGPEAASMSISQLLYTTRMSQVES